MEMKEMYESMGICSQVLEFGRPFSRRETGSPLCSAS